MSRGGIVNYIVQFKDSGVWFDGHVPAAMKECKRVREHYTTGGFETRIVPELRDDTPDHFAGNLGANIAGGRL